MLVLTTGAGVHGFTLDPSMGAHVITPKLVRMPLKGPYYSVNEANSSGFPESHRRFVTTLRDSGEHSSRYVGSLVADFHRALLKAGIFLYPPTRKYPKG